MYTISMKSEVITTRFSASEAEAIRKEVEQGKARSRSDFVRFATRMYMEKKGMIPNNEAEGDQED